MPKSICGGCGAVFSAVSVFDRHRTGKYCLPVVENGKVVRYTSNLRRCITEEAMVKRGLVKNRKGIWTIPFENASKIWYATKIIETSDDADETA